MAVANGYGKVATSGSVFMYDVGDVINSYRGEPTTNLINPNNINIYTWWTRNVATIVQLSETYKGQPIYRVSISIDNGDMLYHITERWGAGSGWYMPYVTFNANTAYIASVIYRPVSHPDTRIYGHPSNISGWGLNIDGNVDIDNQWKMHRIDRNFGSTVSDNRFYHMHTPSATLGQTIIVDITHSQIEQKNRVTPFINGTRSSTQGLLPIVGNSTLDLSEVSFDSNAQIVFDGTNDRINCGNFSVSYLTVSVWVYKTAEATHQGICRKQNGWAVSQYNGTLQVAPGTSWTFYDTGYTIPLNTWVNIVYTYSGTGASDSQNVYINGNRIFNNSNGSGPITSNSNTVNVGYDDNNWYWNGYIANTIIYNRALSSAEVRQNYNKYKTRFNLS